MATASTIASSPRRNDIDVLRGFAILAVLLLHAGLMTDGIGAHAGLLAVTQRLSTGIQLFFVLSGYLVCLSWDRCLANGEGLTGFLVRRAAKIVPLYLLFLHINIGVFFAGNALAPEVLPFRNSVTASNLDLPNYLIHLVFLQGMVPPLSHTLLDGSWSVVVEVYFYLLFALVLARVCRTAPACAWAYAVSLLASMLFTMTAGSLYSGLSHYGFPAQLPCFILGVLACRLLQTPDFASRFAPWASATVACATLLMLGLVKGESKPLGDFHVYALCFAALLLASGTVARLIMPPFAAAFAAMGRQSYALFFVHLVLLKSSYTVLAALHIALPFWQELALNVLIAVPLSWLLSHLVFDRIDRFFVALAARWLNRHHRHPTDWSPA